MDTKVASKVLVTGASRGIGLAMVQQLRAEQRQVIAVGRGTSVALAATGAQVLHGFDLALHSARADLVAQLQGERFDCLLMNAGLLKPDQVSELAQCADAVQQQFMINALAPILLAAALAPQMVDGGKICFITSRMGSISDNSSGGYYGYRMSKAALNAGGKSLAVDLRARGISVGLLHPGYVRTAMTGNQGHTSPEESARGLLARVHGLSLANSGSFWHMDGSPLSW